MGSLTFLFTGHINTLTSKSFTFHFHYIQWKISISSDLDSAGSDLAPTNFDPDYVWNKAHMIGESRKKKQTQHHHHQKPTNSNTRKKSNNKGRNGALVLQHHYVFTMLVCLKAPVYTQKR